MDHQVFIFIVLLFILTFDHSHFVEASLKKIVPRENDASLNGKNKLVAPESSISVKISGMIASLDNGLISITFGNDGTVSSLYKNGKNLVKNVARGGSFYLDWHNGTYHRFAPSSLQVIRKSAKRVHIMYLQDRPGMVTLEYHYIMEQGQSGIYTYVHAANNADDNITFSLYRTVYRFDPTVMVQVTNGVQEGTIPDGGELNDANRVQDATWKLSDGTYYSKYDYAAYIRKTPYQGVFGNGNGAWLISASRDYHSGGPLKQDLTVHEAALILNVLTAGHFGSPSLTAPLGWSKLYGPWLLYFNEGTDEELKADTIRQAEKEQSLWPYEWMNEKEYPLKRATLKGRVTSPVRSMVVLSSSLTEEFDLQVLGYSYSTETGRNGDFNLENIRPGKYKLTAYPIEGYGIGFQSEKFITITEGKNRASLELSVPTEVKWSIGETNRRSDSYRYSNESRNYLWHTLPPADLEFKIGKSDIHTDWYYAQTKPGTWTIRYKDSPNGKSRILRIGIAAGSNSVPSLTNDPGFPILAVGVNGCLVKEFSQENGVAGYGCLMREFNYENDHSVYRSAPQSGNFHVETIIIPSIMVLQGENLIKLTLRQGMVMYDSINFSEK
ncbi:rhamnogalacturonate lyase-like [Belonocnema kinseyi]|uniref:rhamnogalacturonate lyase-like n=1 Tax=Belonocnema kinseyi TaxID=2817044 RepID=UPI00143D6050|nr:rhamnogalacturonate lyase-like [Belonocnema kinseyi]